MGRRTPMNAVTKKWLPQEMIERMTRAALPREVGGINVKPLSGGFCSAVYLVEADGARLVLKVASDDGVKLMRHERMYISVEAHMLSRINPDGALPMPRLVAYDDSRTLCPVPYFFMSFIDGEPLSGVQGLSPQEYSAIREQVGRLTRSICDIPAECFGMPEIPESRCRTNSEFVSLLFEWLLLDAQEKNIEIPSITPQELMALIKAQAAALDTAADPRYIHTDTWAGNVMVKDGRFAGLVDFAAILWGDPLMSHDFHDFGDAPNVDFLRGYGKEQFTREERTRILVYRIWQRLGMVVERGYRGYDDPNMYSWVLGEFAKEVSVLKKLSA